jgi:hypothetical protein
VDQLETSAGHPLPLTHRRHLHQLFFSLLFFLLLFPLNPSLQATRVLTLHGWLARNSKKQTKLTPSTDLFTLFLFAFARLRCPCALFARSPHHQHSPATNLRFSVCYIFNYATVAKPIIHGDITNCTALYSFVTSLATPKAIHHPSPVSNLGPLYT